MYKWDFVKQLPKFNSGKSRCRLKFKTLFLVVLDLISMINLYFSFLHSNPNTNTKKNKGKEIAIQKRLQYLSRNQL